MYIFSILAANICICCSFIMYALLEVTKTRRRTGTWLVTPIHTIFIFRCYLRRCSRLCDFITRRYSISSTRKRTWRLIVSLRPLVGPTNFLARGFTLARRRRASSTSIGPASALDHRNTSANFYASVISFANLIQEDFGNFY